MNFFVWDTFSWQGEDDISGVRFDSTCPTDRDLDRDRSLARKAMFLEDEADDT